MSSHSEYLNLVQKVDELIRSSCIANAQNLLQKIDLKFIPRAHAAEIARLHSRCGLDMRAMQILAPIVYPQDGQYSTASSTEIVNHAICLTKIGSIHEALSLLDRVQTPQAELCRAFCFQSQWNHVQAIVHLRKYLNYSVGSDYEMCVARVNLASCLIDTRSLAEAEVELNHIEKLSKSKDWKLLLKNSRELRGQLAVAQDDLSVATQQLNQALDGGNSISDFFIEKWMAIIRIRKSPDDLALTNLVKVRKKAEELRHWESVRDCDRVLALATKDLNLLLRVYFGTPFANYRETLAHEVKDWATIPQSFTFGEDNGIIFDTRTGQIDRTEFQVKPGQALHLALVAFTSDIYRPFHLGQLFSQIYSGQYFNPVSSPTRVYNVVKRLRKWIEKSDLTWTINVSDQFFKLGILGAGVRYYSNSWSANGQMGFESSLMRLAVPTGKMFSSSYAAEQWKVSKITALKILNWGVENGKLRRAGNNRSTKYGFVA